MRRRVLGVSQGDNQGIVYGLTDGTYESLDGSVVTISDGNHVYAKSGGASGAYFVWLFPTIIELYTAINNINATKIYPSDVLFTLKNGDIVKFVITNNNTSITNKWQALRIEFASGTEEKVISGEFQQKLNLQQK